MVIHLEMDNLLGATISAKRIGSNTFASSPGIKWKVKLQKENGVIARLVVNLQHYIRNAIEMKCSNTGTSAPMSARQSKYLYMKSRKKAACVKETVAARASPQCESRSVT